LSPFYTGYKLIVVIVVIILEDVGHKCVFESGVGLHASSLMFAFNKKALADGTFPPARARSYRLTLDDHMFSDGFILAPSRFCSTLG